MHSQNRTGATGLVLSSLSAAVLAISLSGCLSGGGGGSSSSGDGSGGGPAPVNPLQVSTQQGDYIGIEQAGMRVYRGIRYGLAERFASPAYPPAHEQAVELSEEFGSACPQNASPFGEASIDEDCLFLNVYTPDEPGDYPVMVWVHGGAFIYGSGGATYNPVRLVDQGVVVVTLNYRLGAFGFLPHTALGNSNFGLQDQQLALQWVQDNIAEFNGDPDNVTLFGESAGGHSVMSQLASPEAAGLFHKAIVQSGSYNGDQLSLQAITMGPITIPGGEQLFGLPTIGSTTCDTAADSELLDCLRGLSAEELLQAQPANILPVTGTPTLPVSINQALASGEFNQVPVMMGSNLNEGTLFTLLALADNPTALTTVPGYFAAVAQLLGEDPRLDAQQIAQDYLVKFIGNDAPTLDAYNAIGTDWRFNCPNSRQWNMLQDQVPTWGYWFADQNAPAIPGLPAPFHMGATHTAEIQYVLSSEETLVERGATEQQLELAQQMAEYWTNFARYAEDPAIGPNGTDGAAEAVEWPQLTSSGQVLRLEAPTPTAKTKAEYDTFHNCSYWAAPPLATLTPQ